MFESDDEVFSIDPENDMVPLDSADPEYLRGIEVGYLMAMSFYGFFTYMKVHVSNAEMIMRIAEAYEMDFSTEDTDSDDMVVVTLVPPDHSDYDDDDDE